MSSKFDGIIPPRPESKEQLEEMLDRALGAIIDLIALVFLEAESHAKHHSDPENEVKTLLVKQLQFMEWMTEVNASPQDVVSNLYELLQHENPADAALNHLVATGQSVDEALRNLVNNPELPAKLREIVQAKLNSGVVDQIDAKLRDAGIYDQPKPE